MALPSLSDLQFNASDVAEVVASKVASENSAIGLLASQAQTAKESIDTLLSQAQTAKQSIDTLLTGADQTENYHTNTLNGNWSGWDHGYSANDEQGVRVQRYGKVYVVQLNIYRTSSSTGSSLEEAIVTLTSSNITLPTNNILLGSSSFNTTSHDDYVYRLEFRSNGDVYIHFNNLTGTTTYVTGVYVGVDQG